MTTQEMAFQTLIYSVNDSLNISATIVTTSSVIALTSAELWIQLIFFYIFFTGILTNGACIALCIGILKKENMRTRFFIIIGFLTFCRACYCTNFLVVGVHRSLRTLGIVNVNQRRIWCHSIHFWLINGQVIEQCLLLALVIDRMLAVLAIRYYWTLTNRSAAHVCVGSYLFATLITIAPSYFSSNMFEYAPCINAPSILGAWFNVYLTNLTLALVLAVLLFYVILACYVRIRIKAIKSVAAKSQAARASLQRQMELMPVFRNVVLLHCIITLMGRVISASANLVPDAYSQRVTALGGVLVNLDLFVNVGCLLIQNSDLRKATMWWRNDQVTPI